MNRTFILKVLASTSLSLPLAFGQWGQTGGNDHGVPATTNNRSPDVSGSYGYDRSSGRDDSDRYRSRRADPPSDPSSSSPASGYLGRPARIAPAAGSLWFAQSYPTGAQSIKKGAPDGSDLWEVGFNGASSALAVRPGDEIFCWVRLDSAALPREILLAFNDGSSWEHRAYWGQNLITYGKNGSASRLNAGALPQNDGWVKLAIPAESIGLGSTPVNGMTVSVRGGQAQFGAVGTEPQGTGQNGFGPMGQPMSETSSSNRNSRDPAARDFRAYRDRGFSGDSRRDHFEDSVPDRRDRRPSDNDSAPDDR